MILYNSLGQTKQEFVPHTPGKVNMYTCGPTVYHYAHIGNLRTYIMEDVLEKYLRFSGYDVNRVMNITDVGHLSSDADTGEDKMLSGAKREHKTVMEIAKFYTDAFFADCEKLNIKRSDVVEPATNCIDDFINMISVLLEKGYAYIAGGNVYFDTSKLDNYYVFGNMNEDDLAVGVRDSVEEDENKRNKADFVLWFTKSKFDSQELKWESPWGVGYPGWHIECSCISYKHCGEYLDIHCGGIDNAFPHHTNEIAQSEAFLGHKWCPYWFHVLHLNDARGKMSKSKAMNEQVASILDMAKAEELTKGFSEALDNDLNTSLALTCVYDVLKADADDATKLYVIGEFDKVLSLDLTKVPESNKADSDDDFAKEVEELIAQRTKARAEKDWATADAIRDKLKEMKVVVKDTKDGIEWHVEG